MRRYARPNSSQKSFNLAILTTHNSHGQNDFDFFRKFLGYIENIQNIQIQMLDYRFQNAEIVEFDLSKLYIRLFSIYINDYQSIKLVGLFIMLP